LFYEINLVKNMFWCVLSVYDGVIDLWHWFWKVRRSWGWIRGFGSDYLVKFAFENCFLHNLMLPKSWADFMNHEAILTTTKFLHSLMLPKSWENFTNCGAILTATAKYHSGYKTMPRFLGSCHVSVKPFSSYFTIFNPS